MKVFERGKGVSHSMASIASRRRGDGAKFNCVKISMAGLFKGTVSRYEYLKGWKNIYQLKQHVIGDFLTVFQSHRRVLLVLLGFWRGVWNYCLFNTNLAPLLGFQGVICFI